VECCDLKAAFGATETIRLADDAGNIIHACVRIIGSSVMLAEEFRDMGAVSPNDLDGSPVTISLRNCPPAGRLAALPLA
jgi:PhnB protein